MYFWISLVCMAIFACYCACFIRRARSRLGARLLPVFARYQRVWPHFCHSIFHFSAWRSCMRRLGYLQTV